MYSGLKLCCCEYVAITCRPNYFSSYTAPAQRQIIKKLCYGQMSLKVELDFQI
jgi:hypothetical protein